jgi:hypothetical protein
MEDDAVTITVPETRTPTSMDASTITRDTSPGSSGSPNNIPATLMPAAPPRRLPGNMPKSPNKTSPAPAPMYTPCLVFVVFIFVSSFSFSLVWVIASCVPKDKVMNLLERGADEVLQK